MVSERVEACPFCGCPSIFFEKTNNTDYIKEKEESDIVDNNKDSKKITFNFKNEKIEYPEGTDLFAKTSENKKAKVGIILNGIVCGLWIVLVIVAIVWTIIG